MRRNDLDISADMLKVANAGAKKTHLVYKANLNFNIIKAYLKRLTEGEFIEEKDGIFITTDKGREFLQKYQEIQSTFVTESPIQVSGD